MIMKILSALDTRPIHAQVTLRDKFVIGPRVQRSLSTPCPGLLCHNCLPIFPTLVYAATSFSSGCWFATVRRAMLGIRLQVTGHYHLYSLRISNFHSQFFHIASSTSCANLFFFRILIVLTRPISLQQILLVLSLFNVQGWSLYLYHFGRNRQ